MTNKYYYKDGSILDYRDYDKILHREDGPAVEYANRSKFWYINGKQHREDGPAVEWANGDKGWWLNDIQYNKKDFETKLKQIDNLPTIVKLTHPEQWIRRRVKNERQILL